MKIQALVRFAITAIVVLVAALAAHALWLHYMDAPWTRDGRVRADVVRVAPDVAGLVTRVAVVDNQAVRRGDLLFVLDQARYRNALAQAQANLDAAKAAAHAAGASVGAADAAAAQSRSSYAMYAAQSERREKLAGNIISAEDLANVRASAEVARAGWQRAQAGRQQASAAAQQALAAVAEAQVALDQAQLNLVRTEVRAPVDGYVTNLDVRAGDYASAGAARLAVIDRHSYWINGYFEETKLPRVHVGDPVEIRLMSGGAELHGTVQSIAHGITDADNPTGSDLLANVNPTFNWVRLAQRVPVRVAIDADHLPAGTVLAAGMTATLVVRPAPAVAGAAVAAAGR
ncbi:efflux RND transporter periplasmic adaptor subunit [Dyella sp.]|uniref:efflux RND transporter periplasmic adaptor subunit n=1 Tax=Dyella sp. TaxID=1869338 RepID=UPI003F7DC209